MLVGISGKINSGKDTVGEIIQIITNSPHFTDEAVLSFIGKSHLNPKWEIRKFADKLKDIVCLLLNVDRETLEDREFKEKELGEEWDKYRITYRSYCRIMSGDCEFYDEYYTTEQEALSSIKGNLEVEKSSVKIELIKLTPRLLLQLLGTECGRQIIHPQIWVNALMSEYKLINGNISSSPYSSNRMNNALAALKSTYPNWIITDIRFPNELKAIEDRAGITIRVNRPMGDSKFEGTQEEWDKLVERNKQVQHESEKALDNAEFDYTIQNDNTLEDLIQKVREILILEKII